MFYTFNRIQFGTIKRVVPPRSETGAGVRLFFFVGPPFTLQDKDDDADDGMTGNNGNEMSCKSIEHLLASCFFLFLFENQMFCIKLSC